MNNRPRSDTPNTREGVTTGHAHSCTHTPLSGSRGAELRGTRVTETCAFRVTAQLRGRRPAKWSLGGRDTPLPTLGGAAGALRLRGHTRPPGTVWGVGGSGGRGGFLNGGTEIQEFQDDVPEAINQMPVDEWLL